MTDLLIVVGILLLCAPLLAVSVYLALVAWGLVCVCAGLVRSFGEDLDRRKP